VRFLHSVADVVVIFHHGSTASGGHYTAVVARQDGSGWLHLDDESIEPVPTDQVVVSRDAAIDGKAGEVGTSRREKCAYLAFYQRV
jgi:ubiquitin carboxyl-terminal hydrolase 10